MSASRAGAVGQARVRRRQHGWRAAYEPDRRRHWLRLLLSSKVAAGSLALVLGVALLALLAPVVAPVDPEAANPAVRLQGPSTAHVLGTDDLGRDVFSRLLHGGRISLVVGLSVTLFTAVVGTCLGLVAGYYHRLDGVIMRVVDGLMAFPSILLAIAMAVSLGPGRRTVVLALTLVYTPVVVRVVRGTTLVIKRLPYVDAARAAGLRDRTILRRYVLANAVSPLIVQCTFVVAFAILAEASLSYLGAGVHPEVPTWGNMLRDGQRLLSRAWWVAVFPGLTLFLTVLALNFLGDALRDALDPRSRDRREEGVVR